jgi:hypothetical protein
MVSFYSPQNSRQTAQITRTAVQMAAPPSISHKTTGKRVKKRRKENEQMPVNFRLVLSRCYASLRSHKHRTAPPLASQPAGPRVSDHLSASFRGLSSVCSGDWSKTKKQKKRLHSAPHTVLKLLFSSASSHSLATPSDGQRRASPCACGRSSAPSGTVGRNEFDVPNPRRGLHCPAR